MYKSGYVAILGKPNVGKSTLMNQLLGQKLSIVNPKPGTTRHKTLGILTRSDAQIIFVDTPGFQKEKNALEKHMRVAAKSSLEEADLVLLMNDVDGVRSQDQDFFQLLSGISKPVIGLVNKIDLMREDEIPLMIEKFSKLLPFKKVMDISCLTGKNLDDLLNHILEYLPEGEPYYPESDVSDRNERFFIGEIIREKVLLFLHQEVPHGVAIKIEEMKERTEKNLWYIKANLFVEKDSQKGILIGGEGKMLKKIGEESRKEIEKFLSTKVYLDLWVKVLKDWRKDEQALKRLGFNLEQ